MTKIPSENIWGEFTKTSKIGSSIESLNADMQFSAKLSKVWFIVAIQEFVFNWTHFFKKFSPNLLNFQWPTEVEICGSCILLQLRANVITNWDSFIITNWGKWRHKLGQLSQIMAIVITK